MKVEQIVFEEGDQLIRASGMKGFNVPKGYHVELDVDWSTNTDFFTPSQKKKHGPFAKAYAKQIEQLWDVVEAREQREASGKAVGPIRTGNTLLVSVVTILVLAVMLMLVLRR